ncbi:MAG: hypothetical protein DRI34_07820 [Deltaproteobacteria bacterium]|nr:MAG: hypothetical protein DRI34_07820 [Deltaproteobacteria bacterium]
MTKKVIVTLVGAMLALVVAGCGTEGQQVEDCSLLPEGKIKQECIDKSAPKADRWDSQNDPQLFGVDLEYQLEQLPTSGEAERVPWPSTYWPTYEDSVNVRWQGQGKYSPLEKYDMAFNGWTPPEGFDSLVPFKGCGQEFDQEYYDQLGPAAKYWSNNRGNKAMRDAWDKDDCSDKIETWWGLCHAWTPAAILEDEPQRAVTYNGVTFEVSDIKALLIMMYNNSVTRFVGRRCNLRTDKIERDEFGRIVQSECRDANPGTMHVLLANLLGRDKRAFAEDRTMNYEVWNQPVRAFEVKTMEEKTEAEAAQLIDEKCTSGCDPEADSSCRPCEYTWDADAQRFFYVQTDVKYITESSPDTEPKLPNIDYYTRTDHYAYILELDGEGNIIGGEWLDFNGGGYPSRFRSQMVHPDFFWLPLRAGWRSNPHADLEKIHTLLRMSTSAEPHNMGDAKVFRSTDQVAIPDDDPRGAVATVQVDEDITIGSLKVAVKISHTYVGDLTLVLRHDGQEAELQRNAGGSTHDIEKTYEVGEFSGSARGTWELWVVDNAARDTGTIDEFELTVVEASGDAPSEETFSAGGTVDIPDNDDDGITDTIEVSGSGAVKSLKVKVDITHTWISDLTVELRHGTGSSMLHNREGDSSDDIHKTFVVDEFNGSESGGQWQLVIVDHARQDVGQLTGWSLIIGR